MPTYEHKCDTCQHEWEAEYSIKTDPPKYCPQCQSDKVVRLISLGAKGVVELYGQELVNKLKTDANKLKNDAAQSEKVYANLLGEEKYHNLQSRMDQNKRERRK